MQVYRGLECITNQPTAAERGGVPHHLVGHVDPHEPYDVARYARDAHAAIDGILARGSVPIVAGGSGLYLRAALADLDFPPQVEDYVHRIGRTGRANAIGDAISFICEDDYGSLRALERFIGRGIVRKRAEGFDYHAPAPKLSPEDEERRRSPRNGGSRSGGGQGSGGGGRGAVSRRGSSFGGGSRTGGRGR